MNINEKYENHLIYSEDKNTHDTELCLKIEVLL